MGMDALLKTIVAAACCVVIAGGSYYFWNEYQSAVARTETQKLASQKIARDAGRRAAERLSKSGRCTALAKALTDARGTLPPDDVGDARLCSDYADLTDFERYSFGLYPDALKSASP